MATVHQRPRDNSVAAQEEAAAEQQQYPVWRHPQGGSSCHKKHKHQHGATLDGCLVTAGSWNGLRGWKHGRSHVWTGGLGLTAHASFAQRGGETRGRKRLSSAEKPRTGRGGRTRVSCVPTNRTRTHTHPVYMRSFHVEGTTSSLHCGCGRQDPVHIHTLLFRHPN